MDRPAEQLPSYRNPPVGEVALSMQFQKLVNLRTLQIAEFQRVLKEFPNVEEQPLIPPAFEFFPGSPLTLEGIEIVRPDLPPPPRFLFINKTGDELIQVQQDRFGYNWRRSDTNAAYPRYAHLVRPKYEENLKLFWSFVTDNKLGQIVPVQCDIAYFNQIAPSDRWEKFSQIGNILKLQPISYGDGFPSEPEAIRHEERHLIREDGGKIIGRLYIAAEPALNKDGTPVITLTLTARGKPLGSGIEGVLKFMDVGRDWVVRAFAACTDPEIQQIWGKLDGEDA